MGSGVFVLYDSWLGPANIGKILAVGVTYIERAPYPNQHSVLYTTVPWRGRAMDPLESENTVTVAVMILKTVLELMEAGVDVLSCITDNTNSVISGSSIAADLIRDGEDAIRSYIEEHESKRSVESSGALDNTSEAESVSDPGQELLDVDGYPRVAPEFTPLQIGCHVHQHALLCKSLMHSGGQFEWISEMARWASAIAAARSLSQNWEKLRQLIRTIEELPGRGVNVNPAIVDTCREVSSFVNKPGMQRKVGKLVDELWGLRELSDKLQKSSTTLFDATRLISSVYSVFSRSLSFTPETKKIITERQTKCLKGREWILMFDHLSERENQKEALQGAIQAVRAFSDDYGLVNLEDSLGFMKQFFFEEGTFQNNGGYPAFVEDAPPSDAFHHLRGTTRQYVPEGENEDDAPGDQDLDILLETEISSLEESDESGKASDDDADNGREGVDDSKCSVRSQATEVYSAHNKSSVAPTQGNGGSESSESQLDDADSTTWSRNAVSNQRVVNEHSTDDASPASDQDDADSTTWSRNAVSNQRVVNEHSTDDASPASDQDDADSTTWSRNALSNQGVVNEHSVEAAWSVSNQDDADNTSWSRNCSM
ncbi:hypothetical protein FOZ60_005363 [Perkinsus olseni]|uniref:Uncharacterized protein n=1 Tax=Perkinsus olseni TaxID=32597 RepID=A0A7J6NR71_PEROL|nr:hypothetical protein FOZ60_005363 [Perkinsus olseni]